jgi:hypothetical protein
LELWTAIDSGAAQNLDVDHLVFVPANDVAFAAAGPGIGATMLGQYLTSPPVRLGAPASDVVWLAGSIKGSRMRLEFETDAAGWGSNTTTVGLFIGSSGPDYHVLDFDISVSVPSGTMVCHVEIANLTDNTIDKTRTVTITNNANWRATYRLTIEGVSGKVYQPRVTLITNPLGGDSRYWTEINSITHTLVPQFVQNERVRSDPGSLPTRSDVEKLDSSGNLGFPLTATAVPFWLPPGLSLLYLNEFDISAVGYIENASTLTRTMTATATVYPRFYS